jgi:primosomal protein N' (replication factor Y)
LEAREQFGYPPFGRMVRIIVRGPDLPRTEDAAQRLADGLAELENACAGFRLLGPAPAPIEKLRGNYRFHLILRADALEPVRDRIRLLQKEKGLPDDVQWVADVDPMDML